MDMPLFSLGFEGKGYFEDSHVRLRTVSPKDLDRKRNLGILPHLLKRFSAIPESGYSVQPFLVWIVKKHRPLPAGGLDWAPTEAYLERKSLVLAFEISPSTTVMTCNAGFA